MTESELPDDLRDFAAELQQLRPVPWNRQPGFTDFRGSVAPVVEPLTSAASPWLTFGGGLVVGTLVGVCVAWSCFQALGGRPTAWQQVVAPPPNGPPADVVVTAEVAAAVAGPARARRTADLAPATRRDPVVANGLATPTSGVTMGMLLHALDSPTSELPLLEKGFVAVSAGPANSEPVNTHWRLQKEFLKQPY